MAEDLNLGLPWTNPASGQGRTWTRGLRISSSALEDLNSRRPGRNPTSGQSGTWTRGLRTASSALQPLGHAASVTSPYVEKWRTSEGGFNSVNKKLESHQDFSVKKIAVWLEMQQLQSATNCWDIVLEQGNIENKTIHTPPLLAQLMLILNQFFFF